VNGAAVAITSRRRFGKIALDFAVVTPFGVGAIRAASTNMLATAKAYTETKRLYKDTQRLCEEAEIGFEPIVFEATGGLEPEGQKVLESILDELARATGKKKSEVVSRVKGRISIDLCRAQSRALARRRQQAQSGSESRPVVERTLLEAKLDEAPLERQSITGAGPGPQGTDIRLRRMS
jgi:hypothetical protein